MIKYIALILVLISFNNTSYARQVIDATVVSVYTHDCCGRGPYTAVKVKLGTYSGASCGAAYDNYFAIETSHPNHDTFVSIALTAMSTGKKVNVYGNRAGCIGPFNRADGIAINNE